MTNCIVCGNPMPAGEEMFLYHGYSGKCQAPPMREWLDRPFKETSQIIVEHHIARVRREEMVGTRHPVRIEGVVMSDVGDELVYILDAISGKAKIRLCVEPDGRPDGRDTLLSERHRFLLCRLLRNALEIPNEKPRDRSREPS